MKARDKNFGATAGMGVFQHLSSAAEILLAESLADFGLPPLPAQVQVKASKVVALELAGITQLPPLPTNDSSEFIAIELTQESFNSPENISDNGTDRQKKASLVSQSFEVSEQPLNPIRLRQPLELLAGLVDVVSSSNDLTPLIARRTVDVVPIHSPWTGPFKDEEDRPSPVEIDQKEEVEDTEIVEKEEVEGTETVDEEVNVTVDPVNTTSLWKPEEITSVYTIDIPQPESLLEKVARASSALEWRREQEAATDVKTAVSPPLDWGSRNRFKLYFQVMFGEPYVAWEWSSVIAMILAKSLKQKDVLWPRHSDSKPEIVRKVYSNLKSWHLRDRKVAPKLPKAHCALQIVWLQGRFIEIFSDENEKRGDFSQ